MQSKTLVVLSAVAILGVSSTAMARGAAMHAGGSGMAMHGHRHFIHHFQRNQVLLGGWGWGWPYYDSGYGNNTVVVAYPQATPQAANVTGSIATAPCHWNEQTFTVPSSAGGTRPITVVDCR
jgi:hypothetical protein